MDFFSKCDQICGKLWIWLHLLKKSLMENFMFCSIIMGRPQIHLKDLYYALEIFISKKRGVT